MAHAREIPRSMLNALAPERRQRVSQWSFGDHAPHHYVAALRPDERVTEFGD
jgi:hypothetical protein